MLQKLHRLTLVLPLVLAPSAAQATPLFTEATANLGSPQPCGPGESEGCYSNYVVLADLDGDGDLDAVFASGGGYYQPGDAQLMALYLNDGAGRFTESSASATGGFTGRLRQVAVGDIDGDGDNDLVAPDSWAMQPDAVFVNNGEQPPVFADEGAARLGTSSRAGAARLGDLDDDGDLDLLLTDWGTQPPRSPGTAKIYRNDGSGHFAEIQGALPQDTNDIGTGPIDADFFDADGDFDLDLVLASRLGESLLFLNDGSGKFVRADARLPDQPGPYVYGPDECDVDADGDLDVWLDNGGEDLVEQLVLNDGTGLFSDVTATHVTGNVLGADDNEVQCADLDGDGDFDAVVASLSDRERLLLNDGSGHFTAVSDAFPEVFDSTLGLDFGDVDGNNRLDAITAQGEAGAFLNRLYLGTEAQAADTRAPTFRAVQHDASTSAGNVVLHFAVADATTTDVGPRLREAHVKLSADGTDIPAQFMGGDLYRAVVPVGTPGVHKFKACATDAAGNSACSEEFQFTRLASASDGGPDPASGAGHEVGPKDDGCDCRMGRGASGGGGALVLLLGALALLRRRGR